MNILIDKVKNIFSTSKKEKVSIEQIEQIIIDGNVLDKDFYLKEYKDVEKSNKTPLKHFSEIGITKDRNPNKFFDSKWYRMYYPDVDKGETYPIIHFIIHGVKENRFMNKKEVYEFNLLKESALFDVDFYKNSYLSMETQTNDFYLLHFIRHGKYENLKPNSMFDSIWYKEFYLKTKDKNIYPFFHYIMQGIKRNNLMNKNEKDEYKNLIDSNLFDIDFYKNNYEDMQNQENDFDYILHFMRYGKYENRNPNGEFDSSWYKDFYLKENNKEIYPFLHYILHGIKRDNLINEHEKNEYESLIDSNTFDIDFYKNSYKNKKNDFDCILHFMRYGKKRNYFINKHEKEEYKDLVNSNTFDIDFYKNQYLDMKNQEDDFDYILHFVRYGQKEGRRINEKDFPVIDTMFLESFKMVFDEKSYLEGNLDVKELIAKNIFVDGWSHFISIGLSEIREGDRALHKYIPKISEEEYVDSNDDIKDAYLNNLIKSPFQHFLESGYKEVIAGYRVLPGMDKYVYIEPKLGVNEKKDLINLKTDILISLCINIDHNHNISSLKETIASIEKQWYINWEICISYSSEPDSEILSFLKTVLRETDKIILIQEESIFTKLLEVSTGEYIGFINSYDQLSPNALYEIVLEIDNNKSDFIYSDEDSINQKKEHIFPQYKSNFSSDMLLSTNYINHFAIIKKELFRTEEDYVNLYDIFLKTTENAENINHIPKVLYHNISDNNLNTTDVLISKNILKKTVERRGLNAKVEYGTHPGTYRIHYDIIDEPLVSIIIPFKDQPKLLDMCINAILDKSTYQNYEIIGITNNSEEQETFLMMDELIEKDKRVSFYEHNIPFNYSAINNYAVRNHAKGEHIILLNNDIEIISNSWIESMLEYSQREEVGAVGAKLYYPDDTIQHAGVVIGIGGVAGHSHKHFDKSDKGYLNRLNVVQNFLAVTAACLMVKRKIYNQLDGLDEKNLTVAFNDVDFCLRAVEKGFSNVFTPYCEAYHYESISRGYEDSLEKIKRFKEESGYMCMRHEEVYNNGDPYYSPNLTLYKEDFGISPKNCIMHEKFSAKEFIEEIVKDEIIREKPLKNKVCIFSHFDKDNIIDDYVVYYIAQLSKEFDVLFVSTSSRLTNNEINKIKPYCVQYIIKENYGYDFGAWKSGFNSMKNRLDNYDWVLLCNDSVYGPLSDMSDIIKPMNEKRYDIVAMSKNHEKKEHLQSYFIAYSKKVFNDNLFKSFWDDFKIYEDKITLIEKCEINFTNKLIQSEKFKVYVMGKRYDNTFTNIVQFYWKELIDDKFPFLKIELLKINPLNMNIKDWKNIIMKNSNYPIKLIENHLKRFKT